jgi:DNA-binding MarR family transcriptional regulator
LFEAAGMKGDVASYLVRSLLSEGCIRYATVEKTKNGLRPRLIEREGPTGLITTTTLVNLHPENETRLLSIQVTDSAEQTGNVFQALASEHGQTFDFSRWHALQEWLATGELNVTIPYAQQLAELVPPVAIRLRRDFGMILALIRGHALLHRATRKLDGAGRIIATLDDYTVVRDLVADLVAEGVEATVSTEIRQTVAAVNELHELDANGSALVQIAKKLKLDKSVTSRRVNSCIHRGYLKNMEDKKGRPARIVQADPLPEEQELLPSRKTLADRCTVAPLQEGIRKPPSPPPVEPDWMTPVAQFFKGKKEREQTLVEDPV